MADISRRDFLRMGMMSLPALGTLSVLGEALAAKTAAVGAIAENPSGAAEGEDIIIDGTAAQDYFRPHFSEWLQGGATCCAITLAGMGDGRKAIGNIEDTYRFLNEHSDKLLLATSVDRIREAKRSGKIAAVLHFQGTEPLEQDVGLAKVFSRLGVRVMQLAYNRRNPYADGCEEFANAGLSRKGRELIPELNRLGVVIDVSHTCERSSLEACELSAAPVIASHSNARAIWDSRRNISDDLIKAIARTGGTVGMNGYPAFVSDDHPSSLDQFIDHFAHIAHLVGPRHVALGLDYWTRDIGRAYYDALIGSGLWSKETYPLPPPWQWPKGMEDPSKFPKLAKRLAERGFSTKEVRGIMGGNLLRVFETVWKPEEAFVPVPA